MYIRDIIITINEEWNDRISLHPEMLNPSSKDSPSEKDGMNQSDRDVGLTPSHAVVINYSWII